MGRTNCRCTRSESETRPGGARRPPPAGRDSVGAVSMPAARRCAASPIRWRQHFAQRMIHDHLTPGHPAQLGRQRRRISGVCIRTRRLTDRVGSDPENQARARRLRIECRARVAARRSATASISRDASTPVTWAPVRASGKAARPVPVPTSSARAVPARQTRARRLRLGDEFADRAAEPSGIKRARRFGVGVGRVAVVVAHATSFTTRQARR